MSALEFVAIALAGGAMGFVNNLAGAGGLLGLLAFDLIAGLDTSTANTSMRPAALAIGISGLIAFRSKGLAIPARTWLWGLAAVPGALLGAVFAITLPIWVYTTTLVTIVLVTLWQQLGPRRAASESADAAPEPERGAWALVLFTLVGLHMGFIQVAFGLVAMAVLAHVYSRDLVEVNAAKMVLVITTGLASNTLLATADAIRWTPALALAAGAGVGSFVAGRWSVKRGHGAIRSAVLVVCGFVVARLLFRLFAG